jgi:hypothetical protein
MSFDTGTSKDVDNNTYIAPVSTTNTIWTKLGSKLTSALRGSQPNSLVLKWPGCEVVIVFACWFILPGSGEVSLTYLYFCFIMDALENRLPGHT